MSTNSQRPWALLETEYIPEKGRQYRETFQERNPHGHTWSEHINHWRQRHPDYRERSRIYVAKSRLIGRLGLKPLLAAWGLPPAEVAPVLRRVSFAKLNTLVECLTHWDRLTCKARRTAFNLLNFLDGRNDSLGLESLGQEPTTGGKTQ